MTEDLILQELHTLPEAHKIEVLHFIQFLKWKEKVQSQAEKPNKPREEGLMKGRIVMSNDFNDPMELVSSKYLQDLESKAKK